eukprot:11379448-Alexandrium_andersonii.AAC.1
MHRGAPGRGTKRRPSNGPDPIRAHFAAGAAQQHGKGTPPVMALKAASDSDLDAAALRKLHEL